MSKPVVGGSRKRELTPRGANRAERRKVKMTNNVTRLDPQLLALDSTRNQRGPKKNKIGPIRTAKVARVRKQINQGVMETPAIIKAVAEILLERGVLSS